MNNDNIGPHQQFWQKLDIAKECIVFIEKEKVKDKVNIHKMVIYLRWSSSDSMTASRWAAFKDLLVVHRRRKRLCIHLLQQFQKKFKRNKAPCKRSAANMEKKSDCLKRMDC